MVIKNRERQISITASFTKTPNLNSKLYCGSSKGHSLHSGIYALYCAKVRVDKLIHPFKKTNKQASKPITLSMKAMLPRSLGWEAERSHNTLVHPALNGTTRTDASRAAPGRESAESRGPAESSSARDYAAAHPKPCKLPSSPRLSQIVPRV